MGCLFLVQEMEGEGLPVAEQSNTVDWSGNNETIPRGELVTTGAVTADVSPTTYVTYKHVLDRVQDAHSQRSMSQSEVNESVNQ